MFSKTRQAFPLFSSSILVLFIYQIALTKACEQIDPESECSRFLVYQNTTYPHRFHRTSQVFAYNRLHIYRSLIDSNCSRNAIFLFCATFYPRCAPSGTEAEREQIQYPCRNVCISTRDSCSSRFGWAEFMDCEKYDVQGGCLKKEDWQVNGTTNPLFPPKIRPVF